MDWKKWFVVLGLLALLAIPASAQGDAFAPVIEQAKINAYTLIYKITDGDVTCYWVDGFQEGGLSCLYVPKTMPMGGMAQ